MPRSHSLLRRLLAPVLAPGRRLARDEKGVTAVEFGILALPFFTLIFAILETAMVFFATQVLDSAVEDASRMVKTGQAQELGYDLDDFRTLMCGYTFGLFDCDEIRIKVTRIANFAASTTPPPVQTCTPSGCVWTIEEGFEGGAKRDVVQVFAYYRWPVLINLPYFSLKNQPDNYRLLASSRVFRNEPFN
jgi:Flp pilus assembly pilin Flp